MIPAVLGLGSNMGDRLGHLQAGLDVLASGLVVTGVSPVFETPPVGGPEQPPYLNAVVSALVPDAATALRVAHEAESARDRVRVVRWGPRTLDVDVLTVADIVSDDPVLTLPHPRAHERAFVLAPWAALEPHAVIPGRGSVTELLAGLADRDEVRRRDDLALQL